MYVLVILVEPCKYAGTLVCICFNKETKMSSAWPSLPAGSPLRAHRLCRMTTCCVSFLLNAKQPETNERRDEHKDV